MRVHVQIEKNEHIPYEPIDASQFYHDIDYVIRTWLEHKMHHTYPETGSYNDQDAWLIKDWHTMNVYFSRVWNGDFTVAMPSVKSESWQDFKQG